MNLDHVCTDFKNAWFGELWPLLCGHPKVRQSYPDDASIELGGEMYCEVLSDVPIDRLRGAVRQCIATCDWFPTPAELRRAVDALDAKRTPATADYFGDAVRELSRALVEVRKPDLDPVVMQVVTALGGAWNIVHSTNPETTRAHFLHALEAKLGQERSIASVVPAARAFVPGPEPRQIGFAPAPLELVAAPAEPERELSPAEAAALIAEIRSRARPGKLPPAASSSAMRHAADVVIDAEEIEPATADAAEGGAK